MTTQRPRLAALALAVICALLATGCGTSDEAANTTTTSAANSDWHGYAVQCSQLDSDPSPIMELDAGELLTLEDPTAELTAAACATAGDGEAGGGARWDDPSEVAAHTWYAVGTAADRFDVRATFDDSANPVTADVTHITLGDGCATTADWRGALTLIIAGPADADAPDIKYHTEAEPCE